MMQPTTWRSKQNKWSACSNFEMDSVVNSYFFSQKTGPGSNPGWVTETLSDSVAVSTVKSCLCLFFHQCPGSSSVEQLLYTETAGGSIPSSGTIFCDSVVNDFLN
jgi:hypothetical protein